MKSLKYTALLGRLFESDRIALLGNPSGAFL